MISVESRGSVRGVGDLGGEQGCVRGVGDIGGEQGECEGCR